MQDSALTPLDSAVPWLASVSSDEHGVDVTLTDMRGHYVGRCDQASVELQAAAWGSGNTRQLMRLLHECVEGQKSRELYAFRVLPEDDPAAHPASGSTLPSVVRLEWDLRGSTALVVRCYARENPAEWLRDELVLPLMRVVEQLRHAAVNWEPPAAMPLPTLGAPPLLAMIQHARRSAMHSPTLAGAAETAASTGGHVDPATVAPGAATGSARAAECPEAPAQRSASAAVADEQSRKRSAATLKREEAALKAARKK